MADSYGTIAQADVLNTEPIRDVPNGETYRVDFLIKTDTALLINLEMQQFWKMSYPKRILMYSYRMASRFLKLHPTSNDSIYVISFTVFGCDVPKTAPLLHTSKDSMIQYIYVELNKLIRYTLNKGIDNYTERDYWIRFLAKYEKDKKRDKQFGIDNASPFISEFAEWQTSFIIMCFFTSLQKHTKNFFSEADVSCKMFL